MSSHIVRASLESREYELRKYCCMLVTTYNSTILQEKLIKTIISIENRWNVFSKKSDYNGM